MKLSAIVLPAAGILVAGLWTRGCVMADYEYNQSIGSYWALSDKASTIPAKADLLNKFVTALDSAHLSGNNAIWLKTPNNSYEQNRAALESLKDRMNEIRGMDVTSFQYQQAISQITAQEQGEAQNLLSVFEGLWYKAHHFWYWDWVGILFGLAVWVGAGALVVVPIATAME